MCSIRDKKQLPATRMKEMVDLYLTRSLEDLECCAKEVVLTLTDESEEPFMFAVMARHMHDRAFGQEEGNDIELAYFYAEVTRLLLAKARQAHCCTEDLPEFDDLHKRLHDTLDSRYKMRRQNAIAAIKLNMRTRFTAILAMCPGSAGSTSRTTQPLQIPDDGSDPGNEGSAHTQTRCRDAVNGSSQQANHPENQGNFGNDSRDRAIMPMQNTASIRSSMTDLYLGYSIDDLDECARNYICRSVSGKTANQLAELAKLTFNHGRGYEKGQDKEMAYGFYQITLGLCNAAEKSCLGDTRENEVDDLFRSIEISKLSETCDILKKSIGCRYTRRESRQVAIRDLSPEVGELLRHLETVFLSQLTPCLPMSHQPNDSYEWEAVSDGTFEQATEDTDFGLSIRMSKLGLHPGKCDAQEKQMKLDTPPRANSEGLTTDIICPSPKMKAAVGADDDGTIILRYLLLLMDNEKEDAAEAPQPQAYAFFPPVQQYLGQEKGSPESAAVKPNFRLAFSAEAKQNVQLQLLKEKMLSISRSNTSNVNTMQWTRAKAINGSSTSPHGESLNDPDGQKEPGLVGLPNTGNSCYMNSVLQCLCHVPQVSDLLSEIQSLQNDRKEAVAVAVEFGKLLSCMHSGDEANTLQLKRELSKRNDGKKFGEFQQEDAEELLSFLLNQVNDDLKINRPDRSAIIEKLFRCEIKSTVNCCECKKSSSTDEIFFYLPLEITFSNESCSLQDCLKSFQCVEQLNDYKCEFCSKTGAATKKLDISRLPSILIICFKRFSKDPANCGGSFSKVKTFVNFPLDSFDVVSLNDSSKLYALFAVTNHNGNLNDGHYTAFCKSAARKSWHKFSDNKVDQLPETEVVTSDAYILFYCATCD